METNVLTLDEVKEVLGVSYMTVYRYVKSRRLEGYQVGGVWHVSQEALRQFQEEKNQPKKCTTTSGDARRTTNYAEELERCLIAGDSSGSLEVVKRAVDAGADVERVYLEVLSPAMASIGASWAAGEIDIAIEHQASAIVTRLVGQLSPRPRGRRRGQVLIGGQLASATHWLWRCWVTCCVCRDGKCSTWAGTLRRNHSCTPPAK